MAKTTNEKAIALPFSIDDFGGIATSINQEKIWADRARSVVGTTLTERIMRYDFGTDIPNTLFETQEVMETTIQEEIAKAFSFLLPNLSLEGVVTSFDVSSNTITATVTYSLPNEELAEISVGVATIYPDKPLSEVIR